MNVSHGSMTIFLKSFYMPLTDIRKCAENLNSYGYITSFTSDILYGGGGGVIVKFFLRFASIAGYP